MDALVFFTILQGGSADKFLKNFAEMAMFRKAADKADFGY
jgi:hypothetical protein